MKSAFTILDVGCGTDPIGDVNCDLYLKDEVGHRGSPEEHKVYLAPNQIKNFVLCEAKHLPFKNDVFPIVVCRQTIEHIPQPAILTKELVRVSQDKIVIETLHRYGERLNYQTKADKQRIKEVHVNKFSFGYFKALAEALNCGYKPEILNTIAFPHRFLPLKQIPLVIRVTFTKYPSKADTSEEHQKQYLKSIGENY